MTQFSEEALFGNGKSLPDELTKYVRRRSDAGYGAFVDLNNDLGLMVEELTRPSPEILMPYFYARRIAVSVMYHQGAVGEVDVGNVGKLYLNYMSQIGHVLTREEQIEFQEKSLDSALELCDSYFSGITRKCIQLLIHAAQKHICVRDALSSSLMNSGEASHGFTDELTYSNGILKAEYCLGFFASGWWLASDDVVATSGKVAKYLKSICIDTAADTSMDVRKPNSEVVQNNSAGNQDQLVEYKGRIYAIISRTNGVLLFEEQEEEEWRKYLIHVPDRNGSPYEVAWNGQRFAECHDQERFRRQAPHAEQWALRVLKSLRSASAVKNEETPSRATDSRPSSKVAFFDLILFDLDNTLIKSDDLESFRGVQFCGAQPAEYIKSLQVVLRDDPGRPIYSEQFLQELQSTFPSLKMAVVTQAPRAYAETLLTFFYPNVSWNSLVSFDDVKRGKPDPEGVNTAIQAAMLNDVRKVAFVGDNVRDINTAYFSGCWAVLDMSGWSNYDRSAIEKIPDAIIKQPTELINVIENPFDCLPALERALFLQDRANDEPGSFRVDRIRHTFPRQSPDLGGTVVHVLGRSFSQYRSLDVRRSWHPLSTEILQSKDAEVFPEVWVKSICAYINQEITTKNRLRITVTAIPAKPGRTPRLQYLLLQLEAAFNETYTEKASSIEFIPDLLGYEEGARSHHGAHLSRDERFANVREFLVVNQSIDVKGHYVVVIDDVVTTGATLLVAKQTLLEVGAREVRCLALAKAVSER